MMQVAKVDAPIQTYVTKHSMAEPT
jgi:hypothetical protein